VPITVIYFALLLPLLVRYYTDPACPASWAAEPALRRLKVEFGEDVRFTYVMGGLARRFERPEALIVPWLDVAERSRMPVDPRLWSEAPPSSSYPACMAVKAAAEQGDEAADRYLRALREGFFCFRRKLDGPEALVEAARSAGLDAARFRVDLESNATVEAFGADLEERRELADRELPFLRFGDELLSASAPYPEWRAAALAAGATPSEAPKPAPLDVVQRFGRVASVEVESVCDLAGPVARAQLWRLATEWRVKPVRVLTGVLWEPA
jgi:predicted DsbA family dithiol-disulfide isomerase